MENTIYNVSSKNPYYDQFQHMLQNLKNTLAINESQIKICLQQNQFHQSQIEDLLQIFHKALDEKDHQNQQGINMQNYQGHINQVMDSPICQPRNNFRINERKNQFNTQIKQSINSGRDFSSIDKSKNNFNQIEILQGEQQQKEQSLLKKKRNLKISYVQTFLYKDSVKNISMNETIKNYDNNNEQIEESQVEKYDEGRIRQQFQDDNYQRNNQSSDIQNFKSFSQNNSNNQDSDNEENFQNNSFEEQQIEYKNLPLKIQNNQEQMQIDDSINEDYVQKTNQQNQLQRYQNNNYTQRNQYNNLYRENNSNAQNAQLFNDQRMFENQQQKNKKKNYQQQPQGQQDNGIDIESVSVSSDTSKNKNELYLTMEEHYVNQKFQLLNDCFEQLDQQLDINLDFIDLKKVYRDDDLTLFEKCLIYQKYPRIKQYCFYKLEQNYQKECYLKYIKTDNLQAVYCCIKNGLDPQSFIGQKHRKQNSFMLACYHGSLKVVRLLNEEFQVDIEVKDHQGKNAFILACFGRSLDIIKYLLMVGVDIEKQDEDGKIGWDYFKANTKDQSIVWEIIEYIEENKLKILKPLPLFN